MIIRKVIKTIKHKNFKQYVPLLFIIIIIIIFFSCISIGLGWFLKNKEAKLKKKGIYTIGRIFENHNYKGSVSYFEYYVNDIRYETRKSTYYNGYVVGEFFRIYYDIDNPDDSFADLKEPIFLESQEVKTTKAKLIDNNDNTVSYEYSVNGNKYIRIQEIEDNINFEIGKYYLIEYIVENPIISRIHYP